MLIGMSTCGSMTKKKKKHSVWPSITFASQLQSKKLKKHNMLDSHCQPYKHHTIHFFSFPHRNETKMVNGTIFMSTGGPMMEKKQKTKNLVWPSITFASELQFKNLKNTICVIRNADPDETIAIQCNGQNYLQMPALGLDTSYIRIRWRSLSASKTAAVSYKQLHHPQTINVDAHFVEASEIPSIL